MERTILLVDDEEDIGSALERLLRREGYTILRATSGYEGLELLAKHEVGVILSDQRMPEMTGVEFLTRVNELYPKTVRLVLSGYADLASVTDAVNRGAIYKFLTKPWDNEMLCASVQEAFGHYEMQRTKERLALEIQGANATLANLSLELANLVEKKERQIEQFTHYDALTGLPNRILFFERLEQELARAQRDSQLAAVMLLDLDRFGQVNDSFGYQAGDRLLQAVANRLPRHVRISDTIARMGGDEFGFVLSGIPDVRNAGAIAQEILGSFASAAVMAGSNEVYVAASIGISIYPLDGTDSGTLLRNASAALRQAKSGGGKQFQYYIAEPAGPIGNRSGPATEA